MFFVSLLALYELTPLPTYYKSIDFPSRDYGTHLEQDITLTFYDNFAN